MIIFILDKLAIIYRRNSYWAEVKVVYFLYVYVILTFLPVYSLQLNFGVSLIYVGNLLKGLGNSEKAHSKCYGLFICLEKFKNFQKLFGFCSVFQKYLGISRQ